MIDNALWGFVQPRGGGSAFAERVQTAEAADTAVGGSPTDTVTHNRTRFEADRESSDLPDSLSAVVNDPRGDMLASSEADQSSLPKMLFANKWALSTTLMQEHDRVMLPVRFCGHVLNVNEVNYHPAEKEVLALLLLLKTCYTQLAGRTIIDYTRISTLGWINTSKKLFGWSTQFAVMLSPWHLVVHRVNADDSAFAQLLHSTITNFVGLDKALQRVAPPSKRTPMVRMDPALLFARLPNDHRGFVLSFDGSANTQKHGGYGSCAWILWRIPDWKIEIAASAYLESTTANQAEYMGMNEGLHAAQAYGITDLIVVGGSRLAIQQSPGVIACLKESLLAQLNIHRELVARFQSVRYLHVTREYNASADSLTGETLTAKEAKTTLTERSKSKLEQLKRLYEVIYERPNREVTQVSTLRTLSGDLGTQRDIVFDFALKLRFITAITRQQTQTAKKPVRFSDTHDEVSEALPVEPEPPDRPNDATTDYYWIGLYADVERHVRSCPDCSSNCINGFRHPTTEISEEQHRAAPISVCIYWICHGEGYVGYLRTERRASFRRMCEQKSVRVYAEDPLQQDWDEIVERLVFAINNSQATTRKETPFYLVHGWDAQLTLKTMASSSKRGFGRQSDALAWRREVNRQ
ncbi:unnamed protein product [Phytophthora fragariaefolia]|uniref:Unnamed protein product n=1 Tax=Phytophthora fragariaefolia TaxID=1490495 RepID=A0A9W6XNZ5_9STRA|nr:unnamed protein product [Phytophthora fragariaefolia]